MPHRHQEALASQAQSQLCSNHRRGDARPCSSNGCMFAESSACCPSSSSQCVSIQAQDQAGDLRAEQAGSEDAQVATSGAQRLQSAATMPWQPQTVRPATTAAVGVASAWAGWPEVQRAASQQPLECSTGQVAEPPMCDPKELAWEGLLHAAMGNAQAPPGPGAALEECTATPGWSCSALLVIFDGCVAEAHVCRVHCAMGTVLMGNGL